MFRYVSSLSFKNNGTANSLNIMFFRFNFPFKNNLYKR